MSRIFRHSGIYIRTDAGIRTPADLRGKRIGLPEYQITAVVWMRGMMQHEYGVLPTEIHWRSGGQEEAEADVQEHVTGGCRRHHVGDDAEDEKDEAPEAEERGRLSAHRHLQRTDSTERCVRKSASTITVAK